MPNKIWVSPADGLWIKDDFVANDAVTDAAVGELGWELDIIGNASTTAFVVGETGAIGILRDTTAVTANGDGESYRLFTDGIILETDGYFRGRARYPSITGNVIADNDFYIGLTDSVTATAPTTGISVFSDAGVLNLRADSADHGDVSVAVTGVSTLTSGTTMVLGTWHRFDVYWTDTNAQGGPKNVKLFVDGELGAETNACVLDNDEDMEPKILHYQNSGAGATLEFDIDYYELFISRAP